MRFAIAGASNRIHWSVCVQFHRIINALVHDLTLYIPRVHQPFHLAVIALMSLSMRPRFVFAGSSALCKIIQAPKC